MFITAIILAAGSSSRLGSCKQLLPLEGRPLIRQVTETILKTKVQQVIVVVGCQAERVAEAVRDLPVTIVVNQEYVKGQSSSLLAGLQAWSELKSGKAAESELRRGFLFVLGDQPLVQSKTIDLLIDRFQQTADIILPYYEGQRGNPVLMGEEYLPELLALTGDTGAREIICRYPDRLVRADVTDPGVCLDIDTWEDYLNLTGGTKR